MSFFLPAAREALMAERGIVTVDLTKIAANAELLGSIASPSSLCAVVKADGYGHGAVVVSEACLAGGAASLAVATPREGRHLRDNGIDAPVLLLSEPDAEDMALVVEYGLTPFLYSPAGIASYGQAVRVTKPQRSFADPTEVHLMIDTGMNRVGALPSDAVALAQKIVDHGLRVQGVCTHLAIADDPASDVAAQQLDLFDSAIAELAGVGIRPPVRHAANSAATISIERSHYDMVRCGIALYGLDPAPQLAGKAALQPALSVTSHVSFLKGVPAGQGISYGHRYHTEVPTRVATVPLGYGDGVPRALGVSGATVLCAGSEHRIVGVVTMDQFMFADSTGGDVSVGDEVVLIGTDGESRLTADRWAENLGTINYEIVPRLGNRLARTTIG